MNASDEFELAEDFLSCLDKLVEFTQVELETGIETHELIEALNIRTIID